VLKTQIAHYYKYSIVIYKPSKQIHKLLKKRSWWPHSIFFGQSNKMFLW